MNREWLSIEEAAELSARTPQGIAKWVARYNADHIATPIRRLRGRIHRVDLLAAMDRTAAEGAKVVRLARLSRRVA